MYISDVERKSLRLKDALHFRGEVSDADAAVNEIEDFLLANRISKSDAYVRVSHGRSRTNEKWDTELFFPVNATQADIVDERYDFIPSVTFDDVISVYFRGSLRLYKTCLNKLSAYMKEHNLKPQSSVFMRYFRDKNNINEMHDVAVEMFVLVEEKTEPRDPDEKYTSADLEEYFDKVVEYLETRMTQTELCESIYSLSLVGIDNGGIVTLAADSELSKEIISRNYKGVIEDAFRKVLKRDVALYLTVEEDNEDEEVDGYEPVKTGGVLTYKDDAEELDRTMAVIREHVKEILSEKAYKKYIMPLRLITLAQGFVSFECPTMSIRAELEKKFEQMLKYVCDELLDDDVMVYFTSDLFKDEDTEEKEDDLYSDEFVRRIFGSAKEYIRTNISSVAFSDYIEPLNCEYITTGDPNKVILTIKDEKDYVIPFIEQKYKELIKKGFRYALGGVDTEIRIHTEGEIIDVLETLIREKESSSENNAGSESTLGRIFDIMDANRKAYLQHSADMLADELINLPCEYSDKTIFVKGCPFYSDEEKDRIYIDALKYLDNRMDPDVMKEFVDILSVKYMDKERVILSVPKLHVHKTHKIRMTYLPAITNAFRYAMNGNIEVEIVEE